MSNFLKVNARDVGGAVVSSIIIAVLGYLGTLTNVFDANLSTVVNIAVLTGITSLLKSLGTDSEGQLLGAVKIK